MINILHLIETSVPGGAEKMLLSLVENLDMHRYKSSILLLQDGWLNVQLQKRGFKTILIPQNRSYDFSWLFQMMRVLRDSSVDVMHAHEFAMNTYGSFASVLTGIPIITTVHGKNYYWEKWRRRSAYRLAAKHSKMVAVSEDLKQFLVREVSIKPETIRVLYNGIDSHLYDLNGTGTDIRKQLGINEKQCLIGTVGSLDTVKGHSYFLKAAAKIVETSMDTMFIVAGSGNLLKSLKKETSLLGIEKNVIFLGFREDIPSVLQCMDIFVFPSLSEGLPLAVLEAMAAGKPVVATDVGGIPEVIGDGQTGFLVPPKNPDLLAEKITFLIRDRALRSRFGHSGRARVQKEFSLQNMVEEYQLLYDHFFNKRSMRLTSC